MSKPFLERLQQYFSAVSAALRGESGAAAIFPNAADIGSSRERIYAEFLRRSLPSACNVHFGGFVFSQEGEESAQIDLIITADTCPQFNFLNRDGEGKTFCCIDGTLGIVSVKSYLDKTTLQDALANVASLPPKKPLSKEMLAPFVTIPDYADWPYKIIFAADGASVDAIEDGLFDYFAKNPTRVYSSPNLIHVAGKYSLTRTGMLPTQLVNGQVIPPHTWVTESDPTDAGALARAILGMQANLIASRSVCLDYGQIVASFTLPVPSFDYTIRSSADFYPETTFEGQGPQGTLQAGRRVRLLEKYGEFSLVELDDGGRVQVPTGCLRAVAQPPG